MDSRAFYVRGDKGKLRVQDCDMLLSVAEQEGPVPALQVVAAVLWHDFVQLNRRPGS